MRKLFYMGLESYEARYTLQLTDQEASNRPVNFNSVTHRPSINFDAYIWNSLTLKSDFYV